VIVNDGQMAYEAVRAEPQRFDLVLLDIMMPVMDGMQAFSEIKKINTNIPILCHERNCFSGRHCAPPRTWFSW
jgi:two-component system cell cycle sensor histidine kinase/response regulator CckA